MFQRLLVFCACFLVLPVLGHHVIADEGSGAEKETNPTWVTSIVQLGSSDQFIAATANGLLLREASVCSFNASTPNRLETLYTHPAAVWRVDATSDGGKLASVDYRGNLAVFDMASSKPTIHEKAFERWCQAMMVTPDDKAVLAGNEAGKIMIWDLAANKVTKSVELDGHAVTGLAISPDGSQLAASDGAGHVHLMAWPSLEPAGKIEVSKETAWCVAYVDQGKNLMVGSSDRNLYRCEAKPDAKTQSMVKGSDWITQLAVSAAGQIAAAEVGGRLHFPSTGGADSMTADSGVWSLCWNGEGQLLAGTRKDGIVMAGRSWKWTEPAPPAQPAPKQPAKAEPAEDPQEQAEPESKPPQSENPAGE